MCGDFFPSLLCCSVAWFCSGELKVINIMPERVKNIPPAGDKKRKEVSVSATNESGPPKKRYLYECHDDDCTNIVKKGGVCYRHRAKIKRCSSEGCTKYAKKGGVCWRHGTHSNIAPCAQGNFLCGDVQGEATKIICLSGRSQRQRRRGGGKKQSPIAGRKRKAGVGKKSETAASFDIEEDGTVRRSKRHLTLSKPNYNVGAAYTELEGNVDRNEEGEEAADRAPSEDN